MNSIEPNQQILSGWGNTKLSNSKIFFPKDLDDVKNIVKKNNQIIPRGMGRSYGDPAQCDNGYVLDTSNLQSFSLNKELGILTSGSGAKFKDILDHIVPEGFFIPVSPGTKNITVGGAISSDVHGKNHHCDGSFANHVEKITIIDGKGDLKHLYPSKDHSTSEAFWATCGGMGLTGIIIEATFKLIPISTSLIKVDTEKFEDLESLMYAMRKDDEFFRYSVAWIDSLSKKGRGILTKGNHANLEDIPGDKKYLLRKPLSYDKKEVPTAPKFMPNGILNKLTVGIFNKAWYAKSPRLKKNELQSIGTFFYPLDGIQNWNRIYGPNGFIQYQFVVPDKHVSLIPSILSKLRDIGAPSFLTVLKRFGNSNNGPLSFPMEGWTLAVDIPACIPNLLRILDDCDNLVLKAGGRIYLAKDSRQSSSMFKKSYSRFNEWVNQKKDLDPDNIFVSDLSKRLNI